MGRYLPRYSIACSLSLIPCIPSAFAQSLLHPSSKLETIPQRLLDHHFQTFSPTAHLPSPPLDERSWRVGASHLLNSLLIVSLSTHLETYSLSLSPFPSFYFTTTPTTTTKNTNNYNNAFVVLLVTIDHPSRPVSGHLTRDHTTALSALEHCRARQFQSICL